jgi:hypothetical protein
MDLALSSKFSPQELRGINLCRLFFNALTLSDITNASGNRISPGILDGTTLLSQSQSKGPGVKQPYSAPRAWRAWRKLLRIVSEFRGCLHIPHRLSHWTISGENLRRRWPFLYSATSDYLFTGPSRIPLKLAARSARASAVSTPIVPSLLCLPMPFPSIAMNAVMDGAFFQCPVPRKRPSNPGQSGMTTSPRSNPGSGCYSNASTYTNNLLSTSTSNYQRHHQPRSSATATLVSDGGAGQFKGSAGNGNRRIIRGMFQA